MTLTSLFDVRSDAGLSVAEHAVERMPMSEFIDRAKEWIAEDRGTGS